MPTSCTVTTKMKVSVYLAAQLERGFELTQASILCQISHQKNVIFEYLRDVLELQLAIIFIINLSSDYFISMINCSVY